MIEMERRWILIRFELNETKCLNELKIMVLSTYFNSSWLTNSRLDLKSKLACAKDHRKSLSYYLMC